ncbi:MAG: spore germination protein [Clostridia bacterium]|nr:spore germination protein [Clostridia bacterium]
MAENKIKFGKWEASALIITLIITQLILGFPRLMVETAGTAGWIVVLYVTILALLAFFIIEKLYSSFKGKDLLDISERIGGSILRILVGIIFLAYFIFIISIVLRSFAENMKVITLQQSPISYVTMFFIIGMIAGAYAGIEALVRFCAIVMPIILAGLLLIFIAVSPHFNFENIFPILGTGPIDIFGKGFLRVSVFSAISLLFFITPFIKTHKSFRTVGYVSIGVSAAFFFVGTFAYLLVYPFPIGVEGFLPVYQLSRLVEYGRFFQRIESVFVLIWAASALIYLSSVFYFIVYVFKKTFKLEYYKPLILPFAILIFNISLIPPNLVTAVELESKYIRTYVWIISFVIPIVILVTAKYFKRGTNKEEKKNA